MPWPIEYLDGAALPVIPLRWLPAASAYPPPPAYATAGSDIHGAAAHGIRARVVVTTAVTGSGHRCRGGAITVAATDNHSTARPAGLTFSTQAAPAAKVDGSITAAAAQIGPSVVTINVIVQSGAGHRVGRDHSRRRLRPHQQPRDRERVGAASSSVTLKDGRTVPGKVVGADPSDDLAVVKISLTGLRAAAFASSASLVVGQTVVAVGAPLGLVRHGHRRHRQQHGAASADRKRTQAARCSMRCRPTRRSTPATPVAPGQPHRRRGRHQRRHRHRPVAGRAAGARADRPVRQHRHRLRHPLRRGQPDRRRADRTGKATHAVIGVRSATRRPPRQSVIRRRRQDGDRRRPRRQAGIKVGDVVTRLGDPADRRLRTPWWLPSGPMRRVTTVT